ncbi:MAG: ABC transporter permease [Aristaeellaceae bacterium]
MIAFARRNAREILRDPLSLGFGLGFPMILLALMTLIQRNVPVEIFEMESLLPGICAFGESFFALFSAQLISKDRSSALMMRLKNSPLRARDFILGYALPLLPMALLQGALCVIFALLLGLEPGWSILRMLVSLLPGALVFIALGLICGSLLTERQVGGICGALLTNLSAWLSGAWFDLKLIGGGFETFAYALPFANAVDAARAALAGRPAGTALLVSCIYAAGLCALAVVVFARRMRRS